MKFNPPGEEERMKAIGSIEKLPEILKRAFKPSAQYEPIPVPMPGDWLYEHPENGQTFTDFVNSNPNRPDGKRNKIYLQPLGDFPEEGSPSLGLLKRYTAAYFSLGVEVLPMLPIKEAELTTRVNPYTKTEQILTTDILNLLKKNLPGDAFCLMAITMEDLYPAPSWNFVFGQASLKGRVGIYSFARYDPAFYGEKRGGDYKKLLLWRSCKVLVHEIGHQFGLEHCIFYSCVMNGSNHLQESDARPIHLCPVDLRKLYYSIGFDIAERYKKLQQFYEVCGFQKEAKWVRERLREILGDG
ncbi:hypothetical protein KAX29_06890 [candidate division WOR-3 bacterium]|nr:hypothetical protein [candidate division WOR-3 bacterium]